MELDGITVFVKVVQLGSFSQAARVLGMPNTTVSAKVARLEKRLGVTLIQRTTRKLSVTPTGQAYFSRCLRALEELQAGESELVATSAREPQGLLRITSSVDVAHSILPRIVRRYVRKYPKAQVELIVTNRLVDLVAENVDLGFRAGQLEDSSLLSRKLSLVGGGLWASPAYLKKRGTPRVPADLAKHECLLFAPFQDRPFRLENGKETAEVELKGRILADDLATLRSFALMGEGIGILPGFLCEASQVGTGKLVRVLPKWSWGDGSFHLVYPGQRFVSSKVQAFITLALEDSKSLDEDHLAP
jgi:DNA-binding transcriptional LysR family regulator